MIVAHSDWSVDPRKRWLTVGRCTGNAWSLDAPELTGHVPTLLQRLSAQSAGEAVALGIDCPIGLPKAYANKLQGYNGFKDFLRRLAHDAEFFNVAKTLQEVSITRPFFPAGILKGEGYLDQHVRALNFSSNDDMLRKVDGKTKYRPKAGKLFWTFGANQCGKGALSAWRDVIIPALEQPNVKLWPFDGSLHDLLSPGKIVILETYPAEAMRQVALKLSGSKRNQTSRVEIAPKIFSVLSELNINPSPTLRHTIDVGFGSKNSGEDAFDSLMGVLGMINVINGNRTDTSPFPEDKWEGWVLGQTLEHDCFTLNLGRGSTFT